MFDTSLEPLSYSLDYECPVPWRAEQEDKIGVDYPFTDYVEETLEDYIVQRYLETLWLPDSITCFTRFVKGLRRIRIPPDTDLRDLFEPLLLSVDAIRQKYHVQLPRVIEEEGGAGEIEETMMWFAYGNERFHRKDKYTVYENESGEAVKKEWLTKMEHREMKIQILLCLHILFLQKEANNKSDPPPNTTVIPSTPSKKKGHATKKTKHQDVRSSLSPRKPVFPPTESMLAERGKPQLGDGIIASPKRTHFDVEERSELLMDKLSIVQLMASLPTPAPPPVGPPQPSTSTTVSTSHLSQDTQRDWIQVFCEDTVKPLFQESLPTFYDLFYSKVFPHSPFSGESDDASPSPIIRPQKKFKAKEHRPPSPLKLHEVTTRAASRYRVMTPSSGAKGSRSQENQTHPKPLPLHRHRSRSVSLSVEEVRARGASRGGVASSRALFQGEVEMKRSSSKSGRLFQSTSTLAKAKIENKAQPAKRELPKPRTTRLLRKETESKTLVYDTPIKKLFTVPVFAEERKDEERPEFVAGDEFEWSSEEEGATSINRKETQIFVMDTPAKKCND